MNDTNTTAEKEVKLARPVALEVTGGTITGKYCGSQQRQAKDGGKPYFGHIIEGAGVALDYKTKAATALPEGRWFVFGKTRLDRFMREVQPGERIKITYLGKEKNRNEAGEETEGSHHAYRVTYA